MSRMDGSTVVTGALTAFALGIAAAMGTAGLSGVAVTGRQLAERFDLSWDKFKEIQKWVITICTILKVKYLHGT